MCFVGVFMLGCVTSQNGQPNLTQNVTTNVTTLNQTQNITTNVSTSNVTKNVSAIISKLRVSDFLVIDDSMPNLLVSSGTSQRPQ